MLLSAFRFILVSYLITPSGSQITDLEGYRKVSLFFVLIHALAFQFVGLEGLIPMFNPAANGN
jgi:hypothetical protein